MSAEGQNTLRDPILECEAFEGPPDITMTDANLNFRDGGSCYLQGFSFAAEVCKLDPS